MIYTTYVVSKYSTAMNGQGRGTVETYSEISTKPKQTTNRKTLKNLKSGLMKKVEETND